MSKIHSRRQTQGMRQQWASGVKGLMTVLRVLPEEWYHKLMATNDPIATDEIFDAINSGNYTKKV